MDEAGLTMLWQQPGIGFGNKVPQEPLKLNTLEEMKALIERNDEFIDYQLERIFRDTLRKCQLIAYEMKLRGISISRKQKQNLQELARDV